MPPASDGVRTVGCALQKLVPDMNHLRAIQDAVCAVHKANVLATELLNLHLRRCLSGEATTDLKNFFNSNWLLNAYNEVTTGSKVKIDQQLRATREALMPQFVAPSRLGRSQCLKYDARNLATVAATNVWMHFHKRVLSHVRRIHFLDKEELAALSKDEKRQRRLELLQAAADICRVKDKEYTTAAKWRPWVDSERVRLGIDSAVGNWAGRLGAGAEGAPLLYHLKARPHCFLPAMALMSSEKEVAERGSFSIYPLRRSLVPRHVRFDQTALRALLHIGRSDYKKKRDKELATQRKKQRLQSGTVDDLGLSPLAAGGSGAPQEQDAEPSAPPRKRRAKDEMLDEKNEVFSNIIDLRAAGVARRLRFDHAFTTDGVCARVQMRAVAKGAHSDLTSMPKRGIWEIEQLRHVSRIEDIQVVGVDPGKREIVVGIDMDDPKGASPVRYTQKQRQRDLRSRQYADEGKREKPEELIDAENEMSGFNSRSVDVQSFVAYCTKRHKYLDEAFNFYAGMGHRKRRWKTYIKTQQSEERLFKRLEGIQKPGDSRTLVLAYGSWGLVAGRPGTACNKGNAPTIGVGLMRKLSKRFVVSPTPEAYTSKTCCKCFGECGPWEEKEQEEGRKIRGLRRCTQRDCMIPLNRDRNGAVNIGTNFKRLFGGEGPIRSMSDEDLAFHRATLCLDCD